MALIILVTAVVGALFVSKIIYAIIAHFLPQNKWTALVCKAIGYGAALGYIYFAGYFVMEKDANLLLAWIVALAPWTVFIGWKLVTRAQLIEG